MHKLLIQDDEGKTTVVPLLRDELSIGRREGNTIRLTERNVSRKHAVVSRQNGSVSIEDLGSYNGIRVNGSRISGKVELKESDRVQIGDYVLQVTTDDEKKSPKDVTTQPIDRTADIAKTMPMNMRGIAKSQEEAALRQTKPMSMEDAVSLGDTAKDEAESTEDPARLVILSKNFAGDEFDLTQPTTVIGRTQENDIWLDHRSISRHHAQVVKNKSGGYLIEDLGSSNGVRVNGEEYDRVELRKGDHVDLGHVRFRFVAPGEDFLFSRDGEVVDIGAGGGGRTLLWMLALTFVAAGGALFWWVQQGGQIPFLNGGEKSVAIVDPSVPATGTQEAPPEPQEKTVEPAKDPTTPVVPVEPAAKDPEPSDLLSKHLVSARGAMDTETWADARAAAALALKVDPANREAKEIANQARSEEAVQKKFALLQKCSPTNYRCISRQYRSIANDSVYKAKAQEIYDTAGPGYTESKVTEARNAVDTAANRGACVGRVNRIANQAKLWQETKAAVLAERGKCSQIKPAVAVKPDPKPSGGDVVKPPPEPPKPAGPCATQEGLPRCAINACKSGKFAQGLKYAGRLEDPGKRALAEKICNTEKAKAGVN